MSKIIGIGTDIESINRFRKYPKDKNDRFYKKIFTSFELEYCFKKNDPYPHLTARFAAKEAVIKALSGWKKLQYKHIEVRNDNDKKPFVEILSQDNNPLKKENILISLSHCNDYATAFVIAYEN